MTKPEISIDRLREAVEIDPVCGLRWRISVGTAKSGDPVGCRTRQGYMRFGLDGRDILVHRAVWAISNGRWPAAGMVLDHIDGDGTNNALGNLREVTQSVNGENRQRASRKNTTDATVPGVHRGMRGTFLVALRIDGRKRHFGVFRDLPSAEKKALAMRREHLVGNTL